jgi:phosphatidylglycerol:prolipoprotein diacylglycerol transferase
MRPVLFWLGGWPVYSYAVFTGLGLLIGFFWARKELVRRGLPTSVFWRLVPVIGVFSLVGGRLVHVAFNWSQFSADWQLLLTRWRPGLSFHGVMLGSIAATGWVASRSKVPLSSLLDALAPAAALGHVVGRLGCFLNGCCYGALTALPWGVSFSNPKICPDALPRHPTQLYEAAGLLVLFSYLMHTRRRQRYPGELFLIWMAGYAVLRFLNDFLRDRLQVAAFGLTFSQWFSAAVLVAGVLYHRWRLRHPDP